MLVAVNDSNVKCKTLKEIKAQILSGGIDVKLTVVTPKLTPPAPKPKPAPSSNGDTIKSTVSSSSSSSDMHQMDTMNGTFRDKMKSLNFLKGKKSSTLKRSLRKK